MSLAAFLRPERSSDARFRASLRHRRLWMILVGCDGHFGALCS
jgi:hypothetical protein